MPTYSFLINGTESSVTILSDRDEFVVRDQSRSVLTRACVAPGLLQLETLVGVGSTSLCLS